MQRGCNKPGYKHESNMAFRFTSPLLSEKDQVARECPIGAVLRETPYVYEAVEVATFVEVGAVNPQRQTPWMTRALRVVMSERARLREERKRQREGAGDAAKGARILKEGGHGA